MKNFKILSIFPTAVFYSRMEREFTDNELSFAYNVEKTVNEGNYISKDRYILDNDVFGDIKNELLTCVESYVYDILLYKKDAKPYITQSWLNFTSENQYHHIHTHYNSFLSGVLYLSARREYDKIIFHRKNDTTFMLDCDNYNEFNSRSWHFNVNTGDIILFPSDMAHSVPKKEDENNRCSIAFNVFLKGRIGDYNNSAELFL